MWFIVIAFVVIALARTTQNFCKKVSSREIHGAESFFSYAGFYQLVATLGAAVYLLFIGFDGTNAPTLICALCSAVFFAVDLFTGIEAVKRCSLVVSTMVSMGGLIVSCVVSYFWFKEPMSIPQIIGLFVFFVGVYFISAKDKKSEQKLDFYAALLLFFNFLSNGLIMVAQKYFALKVNGGNVGLFSFYTFLFNTVILYAILGIVVLSKKKAGQKVQGVKLSKSLIVSGIVLAVGLVFVNCLMTELGKIVSAVILFPTSSAIAIGTTTLVGWIVYHERLTKANWLGLFLGLLSIVVIGVFTPETLAKLF